MPKTHTAQKSLEGRDAVAPGGVNKRRDNSRRGSFEVSAPGLHLLDPILTVLLRSFMVGGDVVRTLPYPKKVQKDLLRVMDHVYRDQRIGVTALCEGVDRSELPGFDTDEEERAYESTEFIDGSSDDEEEYSGSVPDESDDGADFDPSDCSEDEASDSVSGSAASDDDHPDSEGEFSDEEASIVSGDDTAEDSSV